MKTLDFIAEILLIIGALNLGIMGLTNFNVIEAVFQMCALVNIVYAIVGIAGIYKIFQWKAMRMRIKKHG